MLQRLLQLSFLMLSISGCTTGLSVATSGAEVVYDRQDWKRKISDYYITQQAYQRIYKDSDRYKNSHVSVASFHGNVLVTGEVPDTSSREKITALIKKIPEVKDTYEHLTLSAPSSALTRASDSWITTKIKAKLIAMNEIDPEAIKVVTENGTVYLMGIVTPDQSDIAFDLAESTEGVQEVIKHFYYMHITKTPDGIT